MKIEFSDCRVDGDVITAVGKFVARLSELESLVTSKYDDKSLAQRFLSAIAHKVADEYLKTNKMELVNAVDLKQITNAIQLKIVEGFSMRGLMGPNSNG